MSGDKPDICVVGAGPVGIKLALDLSRAGLKVTLVEAGGRTASEPPQSFSASIVDLDRHHPIAETARQGIGGTSAIWGGRCVPMDETDFLDRPQLGLARWPIRFADIQPHFAEAMRYLQCGANGFSSRNPSKSAPEGMTFDTLERWCREPNIGKLYASQLQSAPGLRILLNTIVVRAALDPVSGAVSHLEALQDGQPIRLNARAFVMAAGGLETTRMMLATRVRAPNAFGGSESALGAYYMGHLSGTISDIVFTRPGADREFEYRKDSDRRYVRRYMQLDGDVRLENGLLNMSARPELPDLYDPTHGSGVLSLSYLGLISPVIGPRLLHEPLRSRKLGPAGSPVLPHLANIMRSPMSSLSDGAKFLRARFLDEGRLPAIFVVNPARKYQFWYHAEQAPSADSRVTLPQSADAGGPAPLRIDLRYSRTDAESVVATHREMDHRLRRCGVALLDYQHREEDLVGKVLAQARDGAHQIGLTRMSANVRTGVVDANCRVHGSPNLFVAGSAVFPSSGQANPTFTAVALAIRLGKHLQQTLRTLPGAGVREPEIVSSGGSHG